ncbi:hypothetical protein I2I05_21560 [Hymenobacter sp. BT683]|uniref:Lipoprotein n=1 Tax=Hymenobacter jeongseonensis TaxID=2791027 RepID=A0ABS0IPY3_9BACT|nr:hypothetical protein [Hymenobacter jeongseonensis]MBF9239993.1 hypothetical protein [Hymenobacter jeongseonensis]
MNFAAPVFAGGLILLLASCSELPPEDQAFKQRFVAAVSPITDRPVNDTLPLDLATVTPFAWDTVYVFSSTATLETINRSLGQRWPGDENMHEDDNLWVFTQRGAIVNYLEFRGFNYQQEPHFVHFKGHFNLGELFTPATAKFSVIRRSISPKRIEIFGPPDSKIITRPGRK